MEDHNRKGGGIGGRHKAQRSPIRGESRKIKRKWSKGGVGPLKLKKFGGEREGEGLNKGRKQGSI